LTGGFRYRKLDIRKKRRIHERKFAVLKDESGDLEIYDTLDEDSEAV